MGRKGEREGEKHWCVKYTSTGCLSNTPSWGAGICPGLGIKPVTFWFTGQHSIHWATPARAGIFFFCIILLIPGSYYVWIHWSRNVNLSMPDLQSLFPPLCWADHSNVSAKLVRGAPPVGRLRNLCLWETVQMSEGLSRGEGGQCRRKPGSESMHGLSQAVLLTAAPISHPDYPSFYPPFFK